ncbi:MAG: polyprenyl synthetase family protein [Porticoccaceae bacterium]|nr:polyprenyl synthetase family protein [Porticoccaceae bacterium]
MLPFHNVVRDDFDAVNALIIQQLHSDVGLVENIGQHLIDAGGKRLRPLLVLLAAKACGYRGRDHIALAAIIEFIHTATLLHDDVVDTSDLRRGRATANARWGNAPSVLVGDFLYSRSFQMMVGLQNMAVMAILADTTNLISEGEVQQLVNAGNDKISESDYFSVIDRKTAQLFKAAAEVGAIIAGADATTTQNLAQYGHHLGMAYQLADDALDYAGTSADMGKNIGDDLAEGKVTLPLIHVLNRGTDEQIALVRAAIRDGGLDYLNAIKTAIKDTGAIDHTLQTAQKHSQIAFKLLAGLNDSEEKRALQELAEFAHRRTF